MKTKFLTLCTIAIVSVSFISCQKDKEDDTLKGKTYEATYTVEDIVTITETIEFTSASQGVTKAKTKIGTKIENHELDFVYTYTKPNIEIRTTKIDDIPSVKLNGSIEGKKMTLYDENGIVTIYTEK